MKATFLPTGDLPRGVWFAARLTGIHGRPPARRPDGTPSGVERILFEFTIEGGPRDGVKVGCLDDATFDVGSASYRVFRALGVDLARACEMDEDWIRRNLFGRMVRLQGRTRHGSRGPQHWMTDVRRIQRAAPASPRRQAPGAAPARAAAPVTSPTPAATPAATEPAHPASAEPLTARPNGKPFPF